MSDYLIAHIAATTSLREQAKHYGDAVAVFQLGKRLEMLSAELAERQRPMDPEVASIIYENMESMYE